MSEARALIDQIVRESVHPALKARGFRRVGRNFRRNSEGLTQIVNLQASQWNHGDRGQFTLNLGVYFPKAAELHGVFVVTEKPLEPDCLIRMRIGHLLPCASDYWWDVDSATDSDRLGREVASVVIDVALPWLEDASTLEGALRYCAMRGNFWFHTIFALAAGERAMAESSFRRAIETAGHGEFRERLLYWGRKHGLQTE